MISVPEEDYFKDARKSTYYIDWTPFLVITILLGLVAYIMFFVTLHILFDDNFVMGDYLFQKLRSVETVGFVLIGIYIYFSSERKMYRMMMKKPFASLSSERLVLNYGGDSFLSVLLPWFR